MKSAAKSYFSEKGVRPVLVAEDSWVVPARMAYDESPELFNGFRSLGDGRFHSVVRP